MNTLYQICESLVAIGLLALGGIFILCAFIAVARDFIKDLWK